MCFSAAANFVGSGVLGFRFILSVSTNLDSPETVAGTRDTSGCHSARIRRSSWLHRTTDYATVLLPLPGISNDLEVVCLL